MCNTLGNIFRLCIVGGCCLAVGSYCHGWGKESREWTSLILVPIFCFVIQLAMQFVATFGCDFLTTPSTRGIGIWYVEEQGTGNCVEWSTTNLEMDDVVKGAQSALTLSTIAGFAAGVMVLFEWLLCEVCCAGCLEGLAFCSAWVLGCSTFMLYGAF